MPNNVPLTIENFEFGKLRAKPFKSKKSGVFTYFALRFPSNMIRDHLIKIEGNFGVFKQVKCW